MTISCDEDEKAPTESNTPDSTVQYFTRDNEYVKRRIFDLGHPDEFGIGDSVVELQVYQRIQEDERPPTAIYAMLWVDPNNKDIGEGQNEDYSSGYEGVDLIPPEEFMIFCIPALNQYNIIFRENQWDLSLGIWMRVARSDGTVYEVGQLDSTVADLRMIYSGQQNPTYATWDLMWRNAYVTPKNAACEVIGLRIFRGDYGTEMSDSNLSYQLESGGSTDDEYLKLLGLDQYNDLLADRWPDGKLDCRAEVYRPDWGLVIFPHRRPFASDTTFTDVDGVETPYLFEQTPEIYDSDDIGAPQFSKYYLRIEYTVR